ncbi:unnamed protein product [Rhizophagus irregularis]|uniref:Uncharacterized protein n=1 Tax=Rhizophagus irregularis TaxID=588596 RepID=A0A2I1G7A6_9GLOM|nr:hypothetical protein RhiirA4_442015 [Rhizophagus irregularis]CAB4445658.1 unnamed protein product [Rhizophagus irregularis]CAB4445731.1 unnamed protein product [Rhizophagus irregularis]
MDRKQIVSTTQPEPINSKEYISNEQKLIPEFSSFEHQKENILPIKQGRSAATLSQIFSSEPSTRNAELQVGNNKFNAELENLDELDDPFDVYDRYIKWTMENYPQAFGPHSRVCQLLEIASNKFVNDARYKNDPRYLRCWLQYSKHVGKHKELFAFLKSNGIGLDLATFYEEYAEIMETMKCYKEANEIYETGISRGAQPLERLNKRYKQFLTRMTLMDVNLNTNTVAIPTPPIPQQLNLNSRTILGSKSSSSSTRSQPMNVFHQRNPTSYTVSDIESASSQISTSDNNEKLNIFYDPNGEIGNSALSSTNSKTSIWNSYGTYLSRKKEDIQEAEQWKGVTLPQNKKVHAPMAAKLEIYHDKSIECSSNSSTNIRQATEQVEIQSLNNKNNCLTEALKKLVDIQNKHEISSDIAQTKSSQFSQNENSNKPQPTSSVSQEKKQAKRYELGPKEKCCVKIDNFYGENGEEISFEEKRAKTLGYLESNYSEKVEEKLGKRESKVTEFSVPIHETSPIPSYIEKIEKKPSPTICTRAALSDIIEMFTFTQPLKDLQNNDDDDGKKTSNSNVYQTTQSGYHQTPSRTNGCKVNDQENDVNSTSLDLINRENKAKFFDPMTPIQETSREYKTTPFYTSEEFNIMNVRSFINTPRVDDIKLDLASPMKLTAVDHESNMLEPPAFPKLSNPCNPIDPKVIEQILAALQPPLNHYKGFYDARKQTCNNGSKIEKLARCWDTQGRRCTNVSVNIEEPVTFFNDSFLIRQKIGEGGFGKVYLVLDTEDYAVNQNEKKSSRALKSETPSSALEFYIIRKLQERINSPTIDSIISVHSLYYYKNESYMVMEFVHQGTILDAVNRAKRENTQLDELLVFFFTIELLKTIESIHEAGIIHGDIKADNCLLRLEPVEEWDIQYDPSGANGWSKKGIKIIDFGRSIDVTLFPDDMKFIAEWVTDDQDCVEMREGRPWKWQADYYGLAGIVHCMLHNRYMQITPVLVETNTFISGPATMAVKKYKPILSFKRYWQGELWQKLFDLLLNPLLVTKDGQMPITQQLKNIREEFEQHLIQNCEKNGKSLIGMLKKLERNR